MKANENKKKPTFSNDALWNMDIGKLDVDNEQEYIIKNILENGNNNDLNELIRYYDVEKIKHVLTVSPELSPRTAYLAKTLFGINRQLPVVEIRRQREFA